MPAPSPLAADLLEKAFSLLAQAAWHEHKFRSTVNAVVDQFQADASTATICSVFGMNAAEFPLDPLELANFPRVDDSELFSPSSVVDEITHVAMQFLRLTPVDTGDDTGDGGESRQPSILPIGDGDGIGSCDGVGDGSGDGDGSRSGSF